MKKSYDTPTLKVYGSVQDLTNGSEMTYQSWDGIMWWFIPLPGGSTGS